jgi:hypothetical protein
MRWNEPGPHSVWIAFGLWILFWLFLALAIFSDIRAARSMEHEEIVARLATGQCVPSYQTRACRKMRRQLRERANAR